MRRPFVFVDTPDGPMLDGSSPDLLALLLDNYEQLVGERFADPRKYLRPGLSGNEVAGLLARHSLPPTPELMVLYRWADGVDFNQVPMTMPLPQFPFSPLASTFTRYDQDSWGGGSESWGADAGWLRVVADNYGCAVECTTAEVSRIHYANPDFEDEPDRFRAVSLCTLVAWWIEGLENGAYSWDPVLQWSPDATRMPALQFRSGWG